ncbi:MAG TPA: helix-turn-helix domain-containing protein [Eoetvoesiella sp.]|uniref:AraC-like ligand-binding domain-containing protein n=1 Tax=Eoetvoesiella sp. TaxID=1966355 RepID=UPI002BBBF1DA|nr:helix-turn-helix domain-containing protein [Eoetvoesiella sp.]HWK62973.1 helix-turn-helix domain-containing protein [Eoetvoesiella sp.]
MNTDFSTDSVAADRRLAYWRDMVCTTFADIECRALSNAPFHASLADSGLDDVHFCESSASPVQISKNDALVRRSTHSNFMLCIQQEGLCVVDQCGREARLFPGDAALLDSVRPYRVTFPTPSKQLIVHMPREALLNVLSDAEHRNAHRLSGARGTVRLVAQFMQGLSAQLHRDGAIGAGGAVAGALKTGALELIASALSDADPASEQPAQIARYRLLYRARRYIESQLANPELTIDLVASQLSVSTRRLQQVFKDCGLEPPSRYLWQQRLEHCKAACESPEFAQHSIGDIALMHGFNDFSHFSRSFKAAYGCTPREYRNARG